MMAGVVPTAALTGHGPSTHRGISFSLLIVHYHERVRRRVTRRGDKEGFSH